MPHTLFSPARSACDHERRLVLTASAAAIASIGLGVGSPARAQAAFDHSHAAWTTLLKKHVVELRGGQASQVRYGAFAADRAALKAYLDTLSAVPKATFAAWSKLQRMALLADAYNAFTLNDAR